MKKFSVVNQTHYLFTSEQANMLSFQNHGLVFEPNLTLKSAEKFLYDYFFLIICEVVWYDMIVIVPYLTVVQTLV